MSKPIIGINIILYICLEIYKSMQYYIRVASEWRQSTEQWGQSETKAQEGMS